MEICDVLLSNHIMLIFLDGNTKKNPPYHLTPNTRKPNTGKSPKRKKPTVKPRHSFATRALKPTKRRSSHWPCGGFKGLKGAEEFYLPKKLGDFSGFQFDLHLENCRGGKHALTSKTFNLGVLFGFYHGKSTFSTTILENNHLAAYLWSTHWTSKSKQACIKKRDQKTQKWKPLTKIERPILFGWRVRVLEFVGIFFQNCEVFFTSQAWRLFVVGTPPAIHLIPWTPWALMVDF